jgi:hypothetical protein
LVEHAELIPKDSNDMENLPIQPFSLVQDDIKNYWQYPTYFQYVFTESPADSDSIIGLFYSNRSITASSLCEVFPVTANSEDSSAPLNYMVNGTIQEIPFRTPIPTLNASTTCYTSPNVQDCGPRCATVYALENNATASFYYKCHVSVSKVANAALLIMSRTLMLGLLLVPLPYKDFKLRIQPTSLRHFPPYSPYGALARTATVRAWHNSSVIMP